jgi:hypothetical protein
VHSQRHTIAYLLMGSAIMCQPISAQIAEPILTKSAIPFEPEAGAVKLNYAGEIGRSGGSQVIPEATLETGVVSGLEFLVRFPLLRVTSLPGWPTIVGGGQLAIGARYLLAGGAGRNYAISVQTIVEAPTGDTRLVGNATQVMPGVLVDWHPKPQIVIHSNIIFDRSVGGTAGKSAFLEYSNAVVWVAANHFLPVFELVGSSSTITGRTQLVAQPELILPIGRHVELKGGLSLGLNSETPHIGLRTQVAWFWGKRK